VVFVGHATIFKFMTASDWERRRDGSWDHRRDPTAYKKLENCELYPFDEHL
jgi:hypothetical protein